MRFRSLALCMLHFVRNCRFWLYWLHIRMNHIPLPQEENLGYYFQSGTCLRVLEIQVLLCFLLSVVCKWPVINITLLALKIATLRTRLIGYFPIVLMIIFELYIFYLAININCRHLWDVFHYRVTYATFLRKCRYWLYRLHIRINHVPQPYMCNKDFYSNDEFSFSHIWSYS